MFSKLLFSCFLFLSSFTCLATPDFSSKSQELFLGSNNTEFAILRTEREVRGNHFTTYYKKYLDVYIKEPDEVEEGVRKVKLKSSTLIVDMTENRIHYPKLDVTVNQQDSTLKYSELLVEYHQKLNDVEVKIKSLITDGKDVIINKLISEKLRYKLSEKKHPWKVTEVQCDSNSIYLKMKLGDNNRYICILPEEVKMLKERL